MKDIPNFPDNALAAPASRGGRASRYWSFQDRRMEKLVGVVM